LITILSPKRFSGVLPPLNRFALTHHILTKNRPVLSEAVCGSTINGRVGARFTDDRYPDADSAGCVPLASFPKIGGCAIPQLPNPESLQLIQEWQSVWYSQI